MDPHYDYKRYAILYVDDEEMSLKGLGRAFDDTFRILTATNAEDALRLIETQGDEIGVIMSDQRMPGMQGARFLERSRQLRPKVVRILTTAYTDLDAAISSVNHGAIYKYVSKPWDVAELEQLLRRALEFYTVQNERDQLLREKMSVLHKLVITDRVLSLGVLAAGLGHHVRNAMSAVRTFIDLAPEMLHRESLDLNQLHHPAFWQDFHHKVQGRVKLLVDLLDDLSDHAQPGPFQFDSEIGLRDVISDGVTELGLELAGRRIQVINDVPSDLPRLRVDHPKIRKLFQLLLRDELTNLQDGATIRFEAAAREATALQPAGVELLIQDDGPGLPQASIMAVFDPFFVRNDSPDEFGIYLMACYFIVYHHGGTIHVGPGKDGGLAFRIWLPLAPVTGTASEENADFLVRVMTNERLWERLLATP